MDEGELVRRKIYIGTLDEHLVLQPNKTLRLMDVNERRKLIFPETWDISAFSRLFNMRVRKKGTLRV